MKKLESMTISQLRSVAGRQGVTLGKQAKTKPEIVKAIRTSMQLPSRRATVPLVLRSAKPPKVVRGQRVASRHGLMVAQAWSLLFRENERQWKAGRRTKKAILTDEQITRAIQAEFPDRTPAVFKQVGFVRGLFNRRVGAFKGWAKGKSYRYVPFGNRGRVDRR